MLFVTVACRMLRAIEDLPESDLGRSARHSRTRDTECAREGALGRVRYCIGARRTVAGAGGAHSVLVQRSVHVSARACVAGGGVGESCRANGACQRTVYRSNFFWCAPFVRALIAFVNAAPSAEASQTRPSPADAAQAREYALSLNSLTRPCATRVRRLLQRLACSAAHRSGRMRRATRRPHGAFRTQT